MLRLTMTLYSIIATTLMGVGVIAALTLGYDTVGPLVLAAVVGLTLGVPVSWAVARALM